MKSITHGDMAKRNMTKVERCKYLNPERWLNGELCFWRNDSRNQQPYEEALKEYIDNQKLFKEKFI